MHLQTYHLLKDSLAKKKAKKLVETARLMGFAIKLSRAQELVARLMGYDDWSELVRITRDAPERGVPDQMLPPKIAKAHKNAQATLLANEFNIEVWTAETLLEALSPTGDNHGLDWPLVEKHGLRLDAADKIWLEDAMVLVRQFDAAIRPLYALSNDPETGLTHVRLETFSLGKRRLPNRRSTNSEDIIRWVEAGFPEDAPLAGRQLIEVTARAKDASTAFAVLDARIRSLGLAPMLAPIHWTFLMLFRSHVSAGDKKFYTAICPEPRLHIGFDLPGFCFNPENEWNASRALALQLALRREFLDSGWSGEGEEWLVSFRDGNSAKEEIVVKAVTAGAAFAWAAAARGAGRIAKNQTVSSISLISVEGADGRVNSEQTLAIAKQELVIQRGNLLCSSKLKIRGRRKAA